MVARRGGLLDDPFDDLDRTERDRAEYLLEVGPSLLRSGVSAAGPPRWLRTSPDCAGHRPTRRARPRESGAARGGHARPSAGVVRWCSGAAHWADRPSTPTTGTARRDRRRRPKP